MFFPAGANGRTGLEKRGLSPGFEETEEMDVIMPQLGETVTEGTVAQLVQESRRYGQSGRAAFRGRNRQGDD